MREHAADTDGRKEKLSRRKSSDNGQLASVDVDLPITQEQVPSKNSRRSRPDNSDLDRGDADATPD